MEIQTDIQQVIRRSRAFYEVDTVGHYLVRATFPVEAPPVPPLSGFDLDTQLTEWLDVNLEAARPMWTARAGLDDDTLPGICPYFGIAEHSAWLGLDVILQEDTCLPIPVLESSGDLEKLAMDQGAPWFQYMKKGYEYLRSRQDGSFVLSVRGTMAPMDMANAVRGNEFFIDVIQDPVSTHRLLSVLVEATRWYYGQLVSWADEIDGGNVFLFGDGWVPAKCLGHLSNDAAMLCSPEIYDEFGLPYERQLAQGFDRILFHVHNEKMHFVPQLSGLPGLSLLQVSADPKTLPPVEDATRILRSTGAANLMIDATSEQLQQHMDAFAERNVFFNVRCRDRSDAEAAVRFVRERSKPMDGV